MEALTKTLSLHIIIMEKQVRETIGVLRSWSNYLEKKEEHKKGCLYPVIDMTLNYWILSFSFLSSPVCSDTRTGCSIALEPSMDYGSEG